MTITHDDVETKVTKIIAEQLGVDYDDIKLTSNIVSDLAADSLDVIELMMSLEEAFDMGDIPDEDAQKLATVADVIEYSVSRIKAAGND